MRVLARTLITGLKLLIVGMLAALAVILRYLWNTPQPLRNTMPGDPRIYRWMHGHIFYKVAGPTDAQPLVLFHAPGIGASSYEMRNLIEKLGQSYRVYVPDLVGYGLSDRPRLDYRAEMYVQLYQDFVTNIIAQPAICVGSGLSCNYILAVAANRPDLCQRIILLSPTTLYAERKLPEWLAALLLKPITGLLLYSLFTTRIILRKIVARQHTIDSPIKGVQVSSEELTSVFANAHQFGAEHAALAWLAGKLDLDVLPQLEQVTQPVLTIWARHAQNAILAIRERSSHLPAERTAVIEGVGKHIHEERPEQVAARILEWLKEQEEARPGPVGDQKGQKEMEEGQKETEKALENPIVQGTIEAYCVKCRQKRAIQEAKKITTKKGRNAMEGTCAVCGTRLFRFISS
jgi:pimeloyl-ACP methyl ester carboxylesterase